MSYLQLCSSLDEVISPGQVWQWDFVKGGGFWTFRLVDNPFKYAQIRPGDVFVVVECNCYIKVLISTEYETDEYVKHHVALLSSALVYVRDAEFGCCVLLID